MPVVALHDLVGSAGPHPNEPLVSRFQSHKPMTFWRGVVKNVQLEHVGLMCDNAGVRKETRESSKEPARFVDERTHTR